MEYIEKELSNPFIARVSITYIFLLFGIFSANWVVRIPDIQTIYNLSESSLGFILAGLPVGGFVTLLFVGKLISKFGSKNMTMFAVVLLHLLYPLVFLMPNVLALLSLMVLIGVGSTIMNISMNSQGLTIEKDLRTSIISSLHAFFTVGLVLGSLLGSIIISFGISPEMHLLIMSVLFLPVSILSFAFLRKDDKKDVSETPKRHSYFDTFKTKEIWIIGAICFIASIGEWTMRHWGVIYALNYTTKDIAALGFADFSLFMTLGRFLGDFLANRYASAKIIRSFAFLAFVGMMVTIMTSDLVIIFIGFALLGMGLLMPFSFKSAGNNTAVELGSGIAGVAIFANVGSIIEPILVGFITEQTSLQFSFALVGILLLMIVLIGTKLKPSVKKTT